MNLIFYTQTFCCRNQIFLRNICRRNLFKSFFTEKFCFFFKIELFFFSNEMIWLKSYSLTFGRLHPNLLFRNGTNFLDPITILSRLPKPLIFPFLFLYSSNLSLTRLKKLLYSELKIAFIFFFKIFNFWPNFFDKKINILIVA